MSVQIGTVAGLWRYPVKSMCGEELDEIFCGTGGVRGDRLFAFDSSAARREFPYFTARQQSRMLHYRPRFRQAINGGLPNESIIGVESPDGKTFAIDDPALIEVLCEGVGAEHKLTLLRSDRALADAFPISVFSLQTARKLAAEIGLPIDQRRFRANIYLDLPGTDGFAEDAFVGRSLRIGSSVVISIAKRDGRCMMINIDPETLEATPAILQKVAQAHEGHAGVYGTVTTEGAVRNGDAVELLD